MTTRDGYDGLRSPLRRGATLWLLAALLGVVVVSVAALVGVLLLVSDVRDHVVSGIIWWLVLLSAALLVVIGLGLRRSGATWAGLGFRRPGARLLHLLWQIPMVMLLLLLTQALVFVLLGTEPAPEGGGGLDELIDGGLSGMETIALVVGVAVLTPLWEEAVFRGLIQGGVRRRYGPLVAAGVSALCFAAAHGVPILIPYYLTAGLALAWLREFHRSLWAPVAMHAFLNGTVTLIALAGM